MQNNIERNDERQPVEARPKVPMRERSAYNVPTLTASVYDDFREYTRSFGVDRRAIHGLRRDKMYQGGTSPFSGAVPPSLILDFDFKETD